MSPTNVTKHDEKYIIKMPEPTILPDSRGLGYSYFEAMVKNTTKIAQVFINIDGRTGKKQTYGELLKNCIRTALTMKNLGITHEDTISMCTYTNMNSCVPFISIAFLGGKMAPLDPRLSTGDVKNLLGQTHPKLIFADESGVKLLEESNVDCKQIVCFESNPKYTNFEEFTKEKDNESSFGPVQIRNVMDTAVIFLSSGTTGVPKGICVNHYSLLFKGLNFKNILGSHLDVTWIFSSPFWISGATGLTGLLLGGHCRIIPSPQFSPQHVWALTEKFKVTCLFLATVEATALYRAGKPTNFNVGSLKKVILVGSPVAEETFRGLEQIYPSAHITQSYGQSEAAGCITCFNSNNWEDLEMSHQKPLSCGRPIPGIWYKIVDVESGEILGPNKKGELRIRSKCCFSGYVNGNSSEAFDSDGWLKTGDLMYYDENHCFYMVDRLKETFRYKSWFVAPAVVENVLLSHPSVSDAAVIPVAHEKDVNRSLGVVVINNAINPDELVKYVEERVEEMYRLAGGIKIVKELPLTAVGKVNRRILKDMVLSGEL